MANIHIPWFLLELEVERVYKTYQEVGKVTNNQDLGTTEVITPISGSGTFPIRHSVLDLPLTNCVSSGKLLNLLEPQFPILQNGEIMRIK